MIELILLHQADKDIQTAFNRYEEFQEGRGEFFLRRLDAALEAIRRQPGVGRLYQKPYQRMLVRDFPYGIFYQTLPTRIIVAAVMDLRQDPKAIRRKLL